MTEDTKEIENLLSKLHSGTADDKYNSLLILSVWSESHLLVLGVSLTTELRRLLIPMLAGPKGIGLQGACFAAIVLAKLGDHSQDVAWPLIQALRYYAEDPEKLSGPIDEFMSSSNLLCFVVHVAYALSLFKADGEIVRFLVDIIHKCSFPESGENRIKYNSGPKGIQFYDNRINNLVNACLRAIGAIGKSGNPDGEKMLELWSGEGNITAKAALELFGHSWEEILIKESELEKARIIDTSRESEEETEEKNGKEEDTLEKLSKILNLCETDPDAALGFIEVRKMENPGVEDHPILKWVRAMALGGKGLFKALRELSLADEQLPEISSWEARDFREKLRLTDEHLDYLEVALREVREIEIVEPRFVAMIGTDEEQVGEAKVDLIAIALERCRPGKVQELMGTTKLLYFGSEHRRTGVKPGLDLASDDYKILWDTRFSTPSIAKAAITMDRGVDGKGRRFVTCLLYQKCLDEWGPDATLATALSAGVLYFFDDGSWHHSNDTEMVFIGAVMPGMSLPREFRQSEKMETEGPKATQPDSRSEVSNEQESKREEPKKKGFLRKLLG